MLISCPDCQTKVSNNAPSCPKCGYPLKATTVEQTSKKWKALQLLAFVLILIGMPWTCIGAMVGNIPLEAMSLFVAGLLVWLIASICAWWYHG